MEDFWVFVYGTLKRGQVRQACWPIRPIEIAEAWTRGALYNGPSYPAMRHGGDRVRGEGWCFDLQDRRLVLKVLDEIEGTYSDDRPNLYDRVLRGIHLLGESERSVEASLYLYATDPSADGFSRVQPDEEQWVTWP
ncbi:MAG: gamma-glutamylcyclotransferase family protein [Planctomycetota bacterium]